MFFEEKNVDHHVYDGTAILKLTFIRVSGSDGDDGKKKRKLYLVYLYKCILFSLAIFVIN
jgi:hypothetical protein